MRTTIIDVKFDEESKFEVRIGLPRKEKPENAENCRKIIKLLLEKNDVKKYLVHRLPFERASKKATFGACKMYSNPRAFWL